MGILGRKFVAGKLLPSSVRRAATSLLRNKLLSPMPEFHFYHLFAALNRALQLDTWRCVHTRANANLGK